MTSRNLFFKLMKEDAKRRIWTIVLSMLAFFLFLTLILALRINNFDLSYFSYDDLTYIVKGMIGANYFILSFITIVGALICGLSGFAYLHSKKKVDLYHSVPVRRETLFAVKYLNGILIYLIPYAVNLLLCFGILQVNGLMSVQMFTEAIKGISIGLMFYCLIYTLTIIAVMLTGSLIVSCLGVAVFLFYGPTSMGVKYLYYSEFFETYLSTPDSTDALFTFLSPIGHYFDVISKSEPGEYGLSFLSIFKYILITGLLILLALFLYKKRPSEAAGKAMAFPVSKPIIKFLLVVPATLIGGIFLKQIAINSSTGWFAFGLILAFVISNTLIEIIFNFDIRSAFKNMKPMIFSGIVVTIIACIFQFDLLKYDEYMPDKNDIKHVGVYISGLDGYLSYYERNLDENGFEYEYSETYQLENMQITDFGAVYALAGKGIENAKKGLEIEKDYYHYKIKYTLKNGRTIYRNYLLASEETYDLLKDIYENEEYKKVHYPINDWEAKDIIAVHCKSILDEMEVSLNDAEKQEFLDIYRQELMELTLEDLANTSPQLSLEFELTNGISVPNEDIKLKSIKRNTSIFSRYYVYPQFVKTKEFLKAHGFDVDKQINTQDILSATVSNIQSGDETNITYSDKEKIAAILPNLVETEYYWENSTIIKGTSDLSVQLLLRKDEFGNEIYYYYYFRDMIPDFVREDVNYMD